MRKNYKPPVADLISLGDARKFRNLPDYLKMGFTEENVPELIRMATDQKLNWAPSESLDVWAPVHAWRVLGILHAETAIEPLINLFYELREDDWMKDELPLVFGMIGKPAIRPLKRYLSDDSRESGPRVTAAASLAEIGKMNPGERKDCVYVLTEQLSLFEKNEPELNGFLVAYLLHLKAVESISVIREAHARDCVDIEIVGDIDKVEAKLGLGGKKPFLGLYSDNFSYNEINSIEKIKIGRNDPCPCGSGKKYKKCCLLNSK